MTAVTSSVAILCCALLTAALVKLLAPMGKTEKTLKLVIGIFVLICLVSTIKEVFSFMADTSEFEKTTEITEEKINTVYSEKILSTTAQYMADYTQILLSDNDIKSQNVKVKVEADENMVINLRSVSIYIDKDDEDLTDKIISIVGDELKITPEVIAED